VTRGEKGSSSTTTAGARGSCVPASGNRPTGVGDAFRAGFMKGWRLGEPRGVRATRQRGRHVRPRAPGGQSHVFTWQEFQERYARHSGRGVCRLMLARGPRGDGAGSLDDLGRPPVVGADRACRCDARGSGARALASYVAGRTVCHQRRSGRSPSPAFDSRLCALRRALSRRTLGVACAIAVARRKDRRRAAQIRTRGAPRGRVGRPMLAPSPSSGAGRPAGNDLASCSPFHWALPSDG